MKIIKPLIITDSNSYTRSSVGSYFDANGILQSAAIDEFRITHEPKPMGLLEHASTNQIPYSENLSMWPGTAIIGTPNTSLGISLDLLTDNDSGSSMSRYQTFSVGNAEIVYVSLFLMQSGTDNKFYMSANFYNGTTPMSYVYAVDFPAKIVSSNSTETHQLREINSTTGLFRLEIKITNNGTGNNAFSIALYPANQTGVTDTGSVYAGGCQVESNYWSSYIKTVATTVTRQEDLGNNFVVSTIAEPDTGEIIWDSGTAYTVGQRCILISTHRVYECLINNTNASPDVNLTGATPKWILVGPTNKWSMFDNELSTQTIASGVVTLVFQFTINTLNLIANSIAILNCDITTIDIVVKEAYGPKYTKTVDLTGIKDYFDTIPENNTKGIITLTLHPVFTGNFTTVGKIVIGGLSEYSMTQYGSSVGIIDYSTKTIDSFGNVSVVPRAFAKRNTLSLIIRNTDLDVFFNILTSLRSTPCVWIGSDNIYSCLILYGYYKDFEINIAYVDNSTCSLTLEGLV